MENNIAHKPVMLREVLECLSPKSHEHIVDGTFGAGNYSGAILNYDDVHLTAFDRDKNVVQFVNQVKLDFPKRFTFINDKFSNIDHYFRAGSIDGVVLDLGVSSMQLDNQDRGFSFSKEARLDMRMGNNSLSAYEVVNQMSEKDLADIIYNFGGEYFARQIAKSIITTRKSKPINTTTALAEIVSKSKKNNNYKIHPATKTFQAIRIYVNDEINELRMFLDKIGSILKVGGRIVIVTFHELEDRLVKNYFKDKVIKKESTSKYKIAYSNSGYYNLVTKKPIKTDKDEVNANPRSRSALLRAATKARLER